MKTSITKSLTQILVMVFEETYFLKPLSKQNCLINIHECIMFLNQKPCILRIKMAFKSPLEPLLVRRSAPDLVFYDTKRGGDFRGGGATRCDELRRGATKGWGRP